MPSPSILIDGPNLNIQFLDIGDFDATLDIYSPWKEWAQLDQNLGFPRAFDTTGGDPTTATQNISPFYFLRNDLGWRIQAPEVEGQVTVEGDLFPRDPEVIAFTPSTGTFNTIIRLLVSSKSLTNQIPVSGLTAAESAALLLIQKLLRNRMHTDPDTGILTIFDDNDVDVLVAGAIYEDVAAAIPYRGRGAERRDRLV